jgi:hypothetical protein
MQQKWGGKYGAEDKFVLHLIIKWRWLRFFINNPKT